MHFVGEALKIEKAAEKAVAIGRTPEQEARVDDAETPEAVGGGQLHCFRDA